MTTPTYGDYLGNWGQIPINSLPNMQCSGLVRDLRAAISLGNAQATQLQTSVTQFAAMTTRAQQWGAVH